MSLIGNLYKIIAKVLARRLKAVMEKIIGMEQTAFIEGRSNLDGVIILNELINEARKVKKRRMFLKVDFVKAYDMVEWSYLFQMMELMDQVD